MEHNELQDVLAIATAENIKGNYNRAELLCNQILTTVPTHSPLHFETLTTLADVLRKSGNYDESERLCREVIEKISGLENPALLGEIHANALIMLAASLTRRRLFIEAIPLAESALTLAKEIHSKRMEAKANGMLGMIGNQYYDIRKFVPTMEYHTQAMKLYEEVGDKGAVARIMSNIGGLYSIYSDYANALDYQSQALAMLEEVGDKESIAVTMGNIGDMYSDLGKHDKALEIYNKTLSLCIELGDTKPIARHTAAIGEEYLQLQQYDKAIEYFGVALAKNEELGDSFGRALQIWNSANVYKEIGDYDKALEYYTQSLTTLEKLHNTYYVALCRGAIGELYANQHYGGYDPDKAEELLLHALTDLEEAGIKQAMYSRYEVLARLYEQEERWKEHALYYKKFRDTKDDVQSEAAKNQIVQIENQKLLAERDKALAVERALAQATRSILANILPPNITARLLEGETKIADTHDSVSVLFVDIVGFTQISAKLPASELIDILDIVFTRFDTICKKHGLEKIKTIGDAYMAVCGAPVSYENHAERAALAALEMLEDVAIEERFSVPVTLGFRIGLHSGSVVAGIIGENKYSYDLWGDAVNTASRMESHGEEDKIHVSEEFMRAFAAGTGHAPSLQPPSSFASLLSFQSLKFVERGEIDIKGKGKMKTYFLEKV